MHNFDLSFSHQLIGWRDNARHLLLYDTDADSHQAGDGKVSINLISINYIAIDSVLSTPSSIHSSAHLLHNLDIFVCVVLSNPTLTPAL